MRSVPRLGMPTTSPAKASSTSERSWAKKNCGACRPCLAGAHVLHLHAPRELARADAHEGDAVAMVGIHVRLDLEDDAGHRGLASPRPSRCRAPCGRAAAAHRRLSASSRSRTPKFFQRAAEEDGRQLRRRRNASRSKRAAGIVARARSPRASRATSSLEQRRLERGIVRARRPA